MAHPGDQRIRLQAGALYSFTGLLDSQVDSQQRGQATPEPLGLEALVDGLGQRLGRSALDLPDVLPPSGAIRRQDWHRLTSRHLRRLDVFPLRERSPVDFLRGLSDFIARDFDDLRDSVDSSSNHK